MSADVLITYASRTGTTGELGNEIAMTLRRAGVPVDVMPVQDVKTLIPYRAVVLGSAIRVTRWLPEAVNFVRTHRAALNNRLFATYTVSLTLREDTPETRALVESWVQPVRELVHPVVEGYFPGAAHPTQLSLMDRLILRASRVPYGDFRNSAAVRMWTANELMPALESVAA